MQTKVMTTRLAFAAAMLVAAVGTAWADTDSGAAQADTVTSIRPSVVPLIASAQEGILVFASPDGMFKWWFDVRVVLDGNFFVEDKNSLGDGVALRRARFAMKSILWRDYYAELDVDFASEAVAMKDAYIRYDNLFDRTGYVRVGNFKSPMGMEELCSSRYLMFPERSLGLDPFLQGRKMGIEVGKSDPRYHLAGGVFGPDISQYQTTSADESFNYIGRATTNLFRTEKSVVHAGVAGALLWPQSEATTARFNSREEYDICNYKYLDTNDIHNVVRYTMLDGELAAKYGRLRVQGEMIGVDVAREWPRQSLNFGGGYVCASYFLTRDSYPYDWRTAQFLHVIPRGKCGAWEIASRFSATNLNDREVLGGKATAFTVGMNYYPNPNIKIMADCVLINNDANATAKGSLVGNDYYKMIQFRFQAAF